MVVASARARKDAPTAVAEPTVAGPIAADFAGVVPMAEQVDPRTAEGKRVEFAEPEKAAGLAAVESDPEKAAAPRDSELVAGYSPRRRVQHARGDRYEYDARHRAQSVQLRPLQLIHPDNAMDH